jgi:hypothetical protein
MGPNLRPASLFKGMGTQEIPNSSLASNSDILVQNQEIMRSEAQRLSTFTSWPHNDKVEARKIAKAGFFHTGIDSEVKCLWCGTVLNEWEYGDQVMARHRSANPDCPFIRNISDNVPLLANSNNESQQLNSSGPNPSSQIQGIIQDRESQDDVDTPMEPENNDNDDETIADTTSRSPNPRQVVPSGPNLQNYRSEAARLESFWNWTHQYPLPADLASAGFIYTGNSDLVRCVFCGQYVGDWEEEDFPITEHRSLFPHCPFVQGHDVGNIPISQLIPNPVATASLQSSNNPGGIFHMMGEDETGLRPEVNYGDAYSMRPPGREANSGPEKRGPNVQVIGEAEKLSPGIIRHTGPANTKYSTIEARLRTFKDWPPALKQEPRQLADAGFYYIGLSDQTKCFYCEGGLRNWQPDDDPWTEHARWFTKCGYVRLIKGDEFIAKCVDEIPTTEIGSGRDKPGTSSKLSEEELRFMMSTSMVQEVLSMKIPLARVEIALKKKGKMFNTSDELASAALSVQFEEQARIIPEESQPTTSNEQTVQQPNLSAPGCSNALNKPNPPQTVNETVQINDEGAQDLRSSTTSEARGPGSNPAVATNAAASTSQNPMELEQENQRLKEARTCKICMDNEIGVVFLPCGHFICCVKCAPSLRDCPYCRQAIHGTVKTYMS